jgi:hypothetical protein
VIAITSADILLVKASHMTIPKFKEMDKSNSIYLEKDRYLQTANNDY